MGELILTEEQMWKTGLNEEPEVHQRFKQMTIMGQPLIEVVDLFCGGGGFSEGASQAGAKVVLAVDCWRPALDVHEKNHPSVPTLEIMLGGSIVETAVVIREHLTNGSHFHLHGSPPCQALSNASNRNPEEGMKLVNWFLDLVDYMKPDSWSMENVVPVGKRLPDHVKWSVLNSADFGVPQTRKRVFAGEGWVATPTHSKDEWVSVIEALPDLQGELEMTCNPNIKQRTVNEPFRTITSKTPSQTRIVSRRRKKHQPPQSYPPSSPAHTITRLPHIAERFKLEALGSNAKRQNDRSVGLPSKTICGSGNQVGARIFDHSNEVIEKIRSLTLEETMVLQGFPQGYLMPYKRKKDAWVIVGNAVCPPVAKAIVEGIQ